MTLTIHKKWLKLSALAIFSYAFLFFLGSIESTQKPIEIVLDLSNWPLDNNEDYRDPTSVFLSSILGGVLLGWGLLIWQLSLLYDLAPERIRKAVLFSLISWFLLDNLGCILSSNTSNVVTNIGLLFFLVGPLWKKATDI